MASEEWSSSASASASSSSPEACWSSSAGDSYIGSLISLTSRCDIRYEGFLASINPHESTIALQNVRSYGTEGRKKDAPQIPPSDKVYEYILFGRSDIKDLQVKAWSPVHTKQQVHHDPAIIQSRYAHAPTGYPCPVSAGSGSLTSLSSHAAQLAEASPPFPDTYYLYQSGARLGSWVSSALPTNRKDSSLSAPMYLQGFVGALSGQSHAQQQPIPFQPPSAMPQNNLQHPEGHAPTSIPPLSGLSAPMRFSSTANLSQLSLSNPVGIAFPVSCTNPLLSHPASTLASHLPAMSSISSYNQELNVMNLISGKAGPTTTPTLPIPSLPYSSSSIMEYTSGPLMTVPLLAPDQLTKYVPSEPSSLQKLCPKQNDMGALLSSSSNPLASGSALIQAPLLPLPLPSQQSQLGVTPFAEEFNSTAMEEKFNKDEVWGSLGKAKQRGTTGVGMESDKIHDNVEVDGGCDQDPKYRSKPVYNKDDFFDTLSCNSLNFGGRTNFSERMRLDTETFGDFHHRPPIGRGNYGPAYAGPGNFSGSYNRGRDYGYYGYGGRGHRGYRPI